MIIIDASFQVLLGDDIILYVLMTDLEFTTIKSNKSILHYQFTKHHD